MSAPDCLDEETLFTLVDEPDASSAAARHVEGCAACAARKREIETLVADMREPVRVYPTEAFVEQLKERMTVRPRRKAARFAAAGAAVLALAAGVVLLPRVLARDDADGFAARGASTQASVARNVELSLDLVTRTSPGAATQLTPVRAEVVALRSAHLLLSYGTRGLSESTFVLCFAVDARGEIHWLYPAYEDIATDPASAELRGGRAVGPMPTEAAVDELSPGPVKVYALLSKRPLHVSDIEGLPAAELERRKLESRFADTELRTWSFTMDVRDAGGGR